MWECNKGFFLIYLTEINAEKEKSSTKSILKILVQLNGHNKIISFVTSLTIPDCRYLAQELYFTALVYSSFYQSCSWSHAGSLDSAEGQVIITGNKYGGLLYPLRYFWEAMRGKSEWPHVLVKKTCWPESSSYFIEGNMKDWDIFISEIILSFLWYLFLL